MAIPVAAGAMALLRVMTRGALRQTKHLSPFKSKKFVTGKGIKDKTGKFVKTSFSGGKKSTVLRPWAQSIVGKEGLISKVGGGARKTKKLRGIATHQYARGYKHLRKHKNIYGAGVAGAAVWDFLPGKDNT